MQYRYSILPGVSVSWLAVLAGGILLLIFGINSYESSNSDISRLFTGSSTDELVWMLMTAGVVFVGAGGFTEQIKIILRSGPVSCLCVGH